MDVSRTGSGPTRAEAPARASGIASILVGAVCGVVWAAAFRAYMSEIAGGGSRFDWYGTFVAILLAGAITGAVLGLAEYVRRTGGRRHWRWLALAPLPFMVLPLTMPDAIVALITMGLGGGAVAVPLTGMAGGFAVSGRGPIWARLVCGVLALAVVAGIAASVPAVGGIRLGLDQPRGAWVAILGAGCVVVLCLACSIPFRRVESALGTSTAREAVEALAPMRDETRH
ncbi:hypothetical protein ACFPER_04720 [Agromyces aurantiacus]|uniref:Uncharacterized protein n=1 Tax=Agromyces aurantiacus TaxID=165814 RepID=A0ABV9R2N0_9MICO|nr:hypothetical protein [Agromyces aurantiacus]MBM7502761.1 hypothetical protein [Agromyces aurantiacus]